MPYLINPDAAFVLRFQNLYKALLIASCLIISKEKNFFICSNSLRLFNYKIFFSFRQFYHFYKTKYIFTKIFDTLKHTAL